VNNEGKGLEEAVVAYFKLLRRHLLGWTEENHGKVRIAGLQARFETRTSRIRHKRANQSATTFGKNVWT